MKSKKFGFIFNSREDYIKKYRKLYFKNEDNRKKDLLSSRKRTAEYRLSALKKLAHGKKIKCSRCGFDLIKWLQINHKNHDGKKDWKSHNSFKRKIASGERKTKGLNILCPLCNWAYTMEKKMGVKYSIKLIKKT